MLFLSSNGSDIDARGHDWLAGMGVSDFLVSLSFVGDMGKLRRVVSDPNNGKSESLSFRYTSLFI